MIELFQKSYGCWLFTVILNIAVVCIVYVMVSRRKKMQRWCFAWFYGKYVVPGLEKELKWRKAELFSSLKFTVSKDPALNCEGQGTIRLLEIGIGTGLNLQFYPPGCRLITVEPNRHFAKYFDKNRERFAHVRLEKSVLGLAEDMAEIGDASVDVVVSTYVLCSIANLDIVMKEIIRVLVPGGKFYYMEHVSYKQSSWSERLQKMVEPVWSFFSDDCKLTSPTSEAISNAGFAFIEEEDHVVDGVLFVMKPHIIGVATK